MHGALNKLSDYIYIYIFTYQKTLLHTLLLLLFKIVERLQYILNAAVIFPLKDLMTYCLPEVINILPIDDFCSFGIQYGFGKNFIFWKTDTDIIGVPPL